MKKILLLSAFVIHLLAELGVSEPLRVGALLDLSKTYAPQGQAFQRGIEFAVEEVNKASPGSAPKFPSPHQVQNGKLVKVEKQ